MTVPVDQRTLIGAGAQAFLGSRPKMLIDGQWVEAVSGSRLSVVDPATGLAVATVPDGGTRDVEAAVAAAGRAFEGGWARSRPALRERLLLKLADLVEAHADELAQLETL